MADRIELQKFADRKSGFVALGPTVIRYSSANVKSENTMEICYGGDFKPSNCMVASMDFLKRGRVAIIFPNSGKDSNSVI